MTLLRLIQRQPSAVQKLRLPTRLGVTRGQEQQQHPSSLHRHSCPSLSLRNFRHSPLQSQGLHLHLSLLLQRL